MHHGILSVGTQNNDHWLLSPRTFWPFWLRNLESPASRHNNTDSKNSSTAYVILYELIDLWLFGSNRRVGVWLLPWRWHVLSMLLIAGREISTKTCGLDNVCPPDDLRSCPETLCLYIFRYTYALFKSSGYRKYMYIHRECHSVLVKLHPVTVYRTVFRSALFLCCSLWFYQLCLALWLI